MQYMQTVLSKKSWEKRPPSAGPPVVADASPTIFSAHTAGKPNNVR